MLRVDFPFPLSRSTFSVITENDKRWKCILEPNPDEKTKQAIFAQKLIDLQLPSFFIRRTAGVFQVSEVGSMQRKSYKKENRVMQPQAIIVSPIQANNIVKGVISVMLVNNNNIILDPDILQELYDYTPKKQYKDLDANNSACFQLKLTQTSAGEQWKLLFIVYYVTEDQPCTICEEYVFSTPFIVTSNKRS
jgi:hypothetical protein